MENTNNLISCREDLITQFFGYLGAFRYLRRKNNGLQDFLDKINGMIKPEDEKNQKEKSNLNRTKKKQISNTNNIVYIYGNPNEGKTACVELLKEELAQFPEYLCIHYKFATKEREVQEDALVQEIRKQFQSEENLGFLFPYMNNYYDKKECSVDMSKFGEVLSDIKDGKYISAFINVGTEIGKLLDPQKNCNIKKENFTEQYEAITKNDNVLELTDLMAENPYIFFMMDMWGNLIHRDEEDKDFVQYICIIDDFESFINRFGQKKVMVQNFMNMMNELSNIVWILISNEKADSEVSQYISSPNFWRMKGIDKSFVADYLFVKNDDKEITEETEISELSEIERLWFGDVYERTGGYISLINLCISHAKEKNLNCLERYNAWLKSDLKMSLITRDELGITEEREEYSKKFLEDWFNSVWNGREDRVGCSDSDELAGIESVFLVEEFKAGKNYYERQKENSDVEAPNDSELCIPTLCYLVKKSSENVRYSWKKRGKFIGLTDDARECIYLIEQKCMFCLESQEYPDTVYLDPVIVKIIRQHDLYEAWLKIFDVYGISKDSNVEKDDIGTKENIQNIVRQIMYSEYIDGDGLSIKQVRNSDVEDKNKHIVYTDHSEFLAEEDRKENEGEMAKNKGLIKESSVCENEKEASDVDNSIPSDEDDESKK